MENLTCKFLFFQLDIEDYFNSLITLKHSHKNPLMIKTGGFFVFR